MYYFSDERCPSASPPTKRKFPCETRGICWETGSPDNPLQRSPHFDSHTYPHRTSSPHIRKGISRGALSLSASSIKKRVSFSDESAISTVSLPHTTCHKKISVPTYRKRSSTVQCGRPNSPNALLPIENDVDTYSKLTKSENSVLITE